MFTIRRAALRILSNSSTISITRARSIGTSSSLPVQPLSRTLLASTQRRWASDNVEAKKEDVPLSKLQPTPLEEVENVVKEDEQAQQTSSTEAVSGSRHTAGGSDSFAAPQPRNTGASNTVDSRFEPKSTIYVGNLFFDVTEDDLHKEFSAIGPVTKSKIIRDARGLSKGFGYITFEKLEDASKAITTMNSQLFEGRRVSVQYASQSGPHINGPRPGFNEPKNPPSKTLFIGNMSWEMTDRDLNTLFRGIRNVIDVRVAIDRRTGQPRGFAHADFIDVKSAMEARKLLVDKEIYGRKLRIDYSYASNQAPRNQARDQGLNAPPSNSQE